jgi:hypothetical protein
MPSNPSPLLSLSLLSILKMPFSSMIDAHLLLRQEKLRGQGGIDPVNGRKTTIPKEAKPSIQEHLDDAESQQMIQKADYVIIETCRNVFQNMRCPAYIKASEEKIWHRKDENPQQSLRPYYGIALHRDKTFHFKAMDFKINVPEDIIWFVSGIPVLIDGKVPEIEEIVTEVYDSPHLFNLKVGESRGIVRADDKGAAGELKECFLNNLYHEAPKASEALMAKARSLGVADQINHDYFHHAIGVNDDSIYSIMAHGSLRQIGRLALAVGAKGAVVIDNGGSPALLHRRPGEELRTILENYYFRPGSIACIVYAIQQNDPKLIPIVDTNVFDYIFKNENKRGFQPSL